MKCKINVVVTVENNEENISLADMANDVKAFCEIHNINTQINNSKLSFESSGIIHEFEE